MTKKVYDLTAKVGEYTNKDGEKKSRWQNVGSVMVGDDGGHFVLLSRWFNPAGVPDPQGRDQVLLSCFRPDEAKAGGGAREAGRAHDESKRNAYQREDNIPF